MNFELIDYQSTAVDQVCKGLRKGSADWLEDNNEYTAVSLSAATGAGKTVIAAAVIERILFGDEDADVPGDPNAVFLWFTDDPSLNEQTLKKLGQASSRLQPNMLITVDDRLDVDQFAPGKVYFLNHQKLAISGNLVKKSEGRRRYPIWETITNTIRNNGGHYYVVVDEAHRGTGKTSSERQTLVQQVISGNDKIPPAPVVWGISATPKRFEEAMIGAQPSRVLRQVSVPVEQVRESGLLKDVLSIHHRGEEQVMEASLVRTAVNNLKEMTKSWEQYTEKEDPSVTVRPALVIQLPPKADPSMVGNLIDVCKEEWDVLAPSSSFAHCLQSGGAEEFGAHTVHYVKPQNIQEDKDVRVVLFKEALTTGWDCPRAEVMVSLRTAKDDTYIAQLIGRMVRTPLARRIVSDETLNRVRLYLPNFDSEAVESVAKKLATDDTSIPTRVVVDSVDARKNPLVPEELFKILEQLPSETVPKVGHKSQIGRLHSLAMLLAGNQIIPNAVTASNTFLCGVLDNEKARLAADGALDTLIADVRTATTRTVDIAYHANPDSTEDSTTVGTVDVVTDNRDIERLYRAAGRKFRDGFAKTYWRHLLNQDMEPLDAKILVAALSLDQTTVDNVELAAENLVQTWFNTHGDAISGLSEDQQQKYAAVRALARVPEPINIALPEVITMPSKEKTYTQHLYSDAKGEFHTKLDQGKGNGWEEHCLVTEQNRAGFVGWYRNPTAGARALRIPYRTDTKQGGVTVWKPLYPDFVVFHTDENGEVGASLIDPHGTFLADAHQKLKGLAEYAQQYGDRYRRVVSVYRDSSGTYRMLNLKDETIRAAIMETRGRESVETVFKEHGATYG